MLRSRTRIALLLSLLAVPIHAQYAPTHCQTTTTTAFGLQVFTESIIDAAEPACWAPGYAFGSSAIRGAIGPGSSGGTVLTADGSIVGISVGISVGSCGDATVPESSVTPVVDALISRTAARFGPFLAPSPRRRSVGH